MYASVQRTEYMQSVVMQYVVDAIGINVCLPMQIVHATPPGRTICQPPDLNDHRLCVTPDLLVIYRVWNFDFLG